MRLSEFWLAMGDEFGEAYGRVLAHDLVLGELGGRTAETRTRGWGARARGLARTVQGERCAAGALVRRRIARPRDTP